MPNTNFQTIHQMGGAINSFVKQATGRDNVQNIDMEHITVAQNHYYEDVDISGRVVSFNAGAAGIPLEKCLVQIEPVQEGTGDPSPDNVRPISGWTKAKVFVSPTTDEADGTTYIIAIPSEAGTVYGGTLDVTTGELVVDRVTNEKLLSAFNVVSTETNTKHWRYLDEFFPSGTGRVNNNDKAISNICNYGYNSNYNPHFYIVWNSANQQNRIELWLPIDTPTSTNIQICAELAAPITYHLTPQEIRTLLGVNNIWADTGDIEVKFKKIKEFF